MRARRLISAALTMLVLAGCAGGNHATAGGQGTGCRTLASDAAWYGDNRRRINDMLSKLGSCGRSGSVTDGAPLALFDFDNTTARNDIGNATFFWMLRNSKVRQPAGGDWATTSQFLTPLAAAALAAACGPLAPDGQLLPTGQPTGTGCAEELVSVYTNGETR